MPKSAVGWIDLYPNELNNILSSPARAPSGLRVTAKVATTGRCPALVLLHPWCGEEKRQWADEVPLLAAFAKQVLKFEDDTLIHLVTSSHLVNPERLR
ncbi:hypothetical protein N2K84_18050 [Prolixibacteraceae bacterium A06]|uniref:Uncharacterized protein n=1 Tax=Gaoshiqia sediminis TaxID=2986998 RepID=A0AA41YAW6_9BACT|nr:hypothetical protein [Gaoshiqia sediminis]